MDRFWWSPICFSSAPYLEFKFDLLTGLYIRKEKTFFFAWKFSFQIGKWKQQQNMDFVRQPAGTDTLICLCCDFEKEVAMLISANRKTFIVILCVRFWKNQTCIKRYFLFYLFMKKIDMLSDIFSFICFAEKV